ncbi:MAG: acyl-CoA dehydrogenase family protein [Firmicutes bacterium]|nr:acyl-CoA dehydrogenase family protein [Bacillota bacterium]
MLTLEERQVRDAVREFVEREVRPVIGACWREGRFPIELVPRMAELGLFGPTLPERYGGLDLGAIPYGLMMLELERGDSGLRSFASVQGALAMYAIYRYGSEEQRQRWLPAMARGERIGCFGLTEPDAGSDPGAMRTRARRDGDAYVLDGAKRWITNGSIADVAVVWARDDEGEVAGFLVERGTPGFSAPEIETKASMRASVTSELVLEGVRVPADQRLPGARGLGAPLSCLTQARYGIAWGALGAAIACYEEALAYTKERLSFGRPIAAAQLTQERLVDMLARIVRGQLLVHRLGQLKDAGQMTYPQVSLAKRENARAALEVARMARELLGGNGISTEYGAFRHMANLETVDTYEGTYEIHTLIVGREITGEGAFGR